MRLFEKRERAEEARFANKEELRFRARARRDTLLGVWAAGLMGKTGDAADLYASELVQCDVAGPGDDDVLRKIHNDLEQYGIAISDRQISRMMSKLMATALGQVRAE